MKPIFLSLAIFLAALCARAEVKLPAIFGDHMVLQEGVKVPVWGTATPGEKVTIQVGTLSAQATAGADGKWQLVLPPLTESKQPTTMTITGKNTVILNDVLIGDVWICSGQSNMEYPLASLNRMFVGDAHAATAVPAAHDPLLRFFRVAKKNAVQPQTEVGGQWEVCTPETASLFSAVGYFFGRDLRTALNKPIGLIGTHWPGTPAQSWISLPSLQKDPQLKAYVVFYLKTVADISQQTAAYPALLAAYKNELKDPKYAHALPKDRPKPPAAPGGGSRVPSSLYNGMIAPLIPYSIKGVIWYQGEANELRPLEYRRLLPELIADWRAQWQLGDFPFLFVQLARFKGNLPGQNWPILREAQLMALSVPNTGMAVAVDVGNPNNIHPADKMDVGARLALAARHVAYGEKLVYSGPIYHAMKVDGNALALTFTQQGSGLAIGSAPWVPQGYQPLPTDRLIGFTVAGADHQWFPADAKIVGDTVIVSSPKVPQPVAARYDWANSPEGNLYNKEGLPASPFRTDDLPPDYSSSLPPATQQSPE